MIKSEVVAHSISPQGDELISILATFPRIILAEVNTHRMLSKNTSSSRAIPFPKMLEAVKNNPFIPIAWQKDHSGMQGTEYFTTQEEIRNNQFLWLKARDEAVNNAQDLYNIVGTTKQLCNRLLEPFMWTTMLITGSREGWENFFKLRCPTYKLQCMAGSVYHYKSKKDALADRENSWDSEFDFSSNIEWLQRNLGQAEIHMMALAEAIYDSVNESTPKQLKPGEWHIPFEDKITSFALNSEYGTEFVKISVAMAARTSYTIVGEEKEIDFKSLIGLHDRLLNQEPPHSSPFEHTARAMNEDEYESFSKTFWLDNESELNMKVENGWCYNLKGFIPYRYLVDNSLTL